MEAIRRESNGPKPSVTSAAQAVKKYVKGAYSRFKKSPPAAKAIVLLFFASGVLVLTVFGVFGPRLIGQKLYDWSQELRKFRFGWLILVTIIAVTSFPPLIGWSTSISVCGFAYGVKGWFVAALGATIGAAASFLILRLLFSKRLNAWSKSSDKWVALENVIRARGLPLIILIRLSPFPPWVYANLLFASIETVSFFQFMVATLCYTPKLMIAVWIGSRIAMLSDGHQREEMDTKAKIVNTLSIVLSIAIAIATGWVIWRLTEKEIRKTARAGSEDPALATEALENAVEEGGRALSPTRYRDDPSDELPSSRT